MLLIVNLTGWIVNDCCTFKTMQPESNKKYEVLNFWKLISETTFLHQKFQKWLILGCLHSSYHIDETHFDFPDILTECIWLTSFDPPRKAWVHISVNDLYFQNTKYVIFSLSTKGEGERIRVGMDFVKVSAFWENIKLIWYVNSQISFLKKSFCSAAL